MGTKLPLCDLGGLLWRSVHIKQNSSNMRASQSLFGFTSMSDYIKRSAVTQRLIGGKKKNELEHEKAQRQTTKGENYLLTNEKQVSQTGGCASAVTCSDRSCRAAWQVSTLGRVITALPHN